KAHKPASVVAVSAGIRYWQYPPTPRSARTTGRGSPSALIGAPARVRRRVAAERSGRGRPGGTQRRHPWGGLQHRSVGAGGLDDVRSGGDPEVGLHLRLDLPERFDEFAEEAVVDPFHEQQVEAAVLFGETLSRLGLG